MENLKYDSLHKFFVSLGIFFIASPFILLLVVLSKDITLISKENFEALSIYSQKQIQYQDYWINIFSEYFLLGVIVSIVLGVIILLFGIRKWSKVQDDLDAVNAATRLKLELEANSMMPSDKMRNAAEEIQESIEGNSLQQQDGIMRYLDIEERYFSWMLSAQIKQRYFINRNVRIDKYEYDCIAISKRDNIDRIYELKVWKSNPNPVLLRKVFERLYNSGVSYESITCRNFKCILVIVAPRNILEEIEQSVAKARRIYDEKSFGYIDVECIPEEKLLVRNE